MKKQEFLKFLKKVSDNLDKEDIKHEIPFCYITQEDFNYINIVVPDYIQPFDISKIFNVNKSKEKCGIIFSEIENFPINFIKVDSDYWGYSFFYYNWNILNVLVNILASEFNLEYTSTGLYYNCSGHKIFITKNMIDIFDFFDLDFRQVNGGFLSIESIFKYVASSPYFDSNYFTIDNFKKLDIMYEYNKEYYSYIIDIMPKTYGSIKSLDEQTELIDSFFYGCEFYKKILDLQYRLEFNE